MVQKMMKVDHKDVGTKNLLSQYGNASTFKAFMESFLDGLDEIEEEFEKFKTDLILSDAIRSGLDLYAEILDLEEKPADDDSYRVLLYGLIAAYNSLGTPQDMKSILTLVLSADDIYIQEALGGARFQFTAFNPDFFFDKELLKDIIKLAKPVGVEFQGYTVSGEFDQDVFSFATDTRPRSEGFAVAIPSDDPSVEYDTVGGGTISVFFNA